MIFIPHSQIGAYLDSLPEDQPVTGNIMFDKDGIWIDTVADGISDNEGIR